MTDDRVRKVLLSGLLDESWYKAVYPDVVISGMSAAEHFVYYGALAERDPSPYFNVSCYMEENRELRESGENPLWHYLHHSSQVKKQVAISNMNPPDPWVERLLSISAGKLEAKLWGGFSGEVLSALQAKLLSPDQETKERSYAAWALARWFAFRQSYDRALLHLRQREVIEPACTASRAHFLLLADCLSRLGRAEKAERLACRRLKAEPEEVNYRLSLANALSMCTAEPAEWLKEVNVMFSQSRLLPLSLKEPAGSLSIFNVHSEVPVERRVEHVAKVSIIMPAYNAADQIEMAIHSLLNQTWRNIEVLVADDCSSDSTREVVFAIAREDDRVKLVPLSVNGGAYAARNTALEWATGEFVTVHDSDDWSHPQKLELQVTNLLNNSGCMANLTDWTRATEELYFTGTFRAHSSLVSENTSSLMFRREVLDVLGGWGLARTSSDSEFVMRIRAYYGEESVERLYRDLPLSFALDQERSLTRTPVTHARTLFYGARREFRETAQAWHRLCVEEGCRHRLKVPVGRPSLPFPIPSVMEAKRSDKPREYDVVVVSDFNLQGGAYISTMNYVNAAMAAGKSVAIFHWRRIDLDVNVPLKAELRYRAQKGDFDILTAGEEIKANLVLVGYPVVLNYKLDAIPDIEAERFAILVNQMASRLTTGGDPQYDPDRINRNVRELFRIEPVWVPISGHVRNLMQEDVRYPVPHKTIWNPLLAIDQWCVFKTSWRGDVRSRPVIGRHSRDHYTKWPAARESLEAAYCVNRDCEVRLLGGAAHALGTLGYQPDNWVVEEYAETTHNFLQNLDFFVHFPHEQYIEEFGRAVLEAMGLGIPAILPPVFRDTFGEAALYAEPEEVWPLIERLWRDHAAYEAASEKALEFVKANAGYDVLPGRLERLKGCGGG